MDIMSKIKKSLIILSIPAAISCSTIKFANIEAYKDDMYPSDKIVRVEKSYANSNITPRNINPEYNQNIESKLDNSQIYYDNYYSNSVNQSYFRDSDGDGISNIHDPMPYRFGPYIDSNFNGIVDLGDITISTGFNNSYWNGWNYPLNYNLYGFNPYYNSNSFFYPGYNNYFYPRNNIIVYTTRENSNVVYGKRPSREEFSDRTRNRINNTNNSRSNRSGNINPDRTNWNNSNSPSRSNNSGRTQYDFNNQRTNQNNWNISPSRSQYNQENRSSQPSAPPVQRSTIPTRKRDN